MRLAAGRQTEWLCGRNPMMRSRTFLGSGLLGLLMLAVAAHAQESSAIKVLQVLGGRVQVDRERAGHPVVAVSLSDAPVPEAALQAIKTLKNLQVLELAATGLRDEALKELAGLKKLETLDLSDTQVTDAGLVHLKGLTNLQSLDLWGTPVTDAGLKELRNLKSLM